MEVQLAENGSQQNIRSHKETGVEGLVIMIPERRYAADLSIKNITDA